MHQKGVILLPILVVIFIIGVVGFLLFQNYQSDLDDIFFSPEPYQTDVKSSPAAKEVRPTPELISTEGWEIFTDNYNGFSIKYPSDWVVSKQGGESNSWVNISSPDKAPLGSQQPMIGMSIGIQVHDYTRQLTQNDLKSIEYDEGVLKHYEVDVISENYTDINGRQAFNYEYEGNESSYSFYFWGINVADNRKIISVNLTDFKVDSSLNTASLAPRILSTFTFTE